MPSYAIIYATKTSALRRVVATDDPVPMSREAMGVLPGESVLVVNHSNPEGHGHHDWAQAVEKETGIYPPTTTCALIENNIVKQIICADPDLDASPTGQEMVLCYSPQIIAGCTYDPWTGLFTHPGGSLPPHSPGNDTDSPIDVPPSVIPKP
jgi:hypothetical protein